MDSNTRNLRMISRNRQGVRATGAEVLAVRTKAPRTLCAGQVFRLIWSSLQERERERDRERERERESTVHVRLC